MGKGVRYAVWRKVGRVWVVRPPGWPRNVELSFTDMGDMLEWAANARVIQKDGNRRYA